MNQESFNVCRMKIFCFTQQGTSVSPGERVSGRIVPHLYLPPHLVFPKGGKEANRASEILEYSSGEAQHWTNLQRPKHRVLIYTHPLSLLLSKVFQTSWIDALYRISKFEKTCFVFFFPVPSPRFSVPINFSTFSVPSYDWIDEATPSIMRLVGCTL